MTVELQQSDFVMTAALESLWAQSSDLNMCRLPKHLYQQPEGLWHYNSKQSSSFKLHGSLKSITHCMEDLSHFKLMSKVGKADINRQYDGTHLYNSHNGFLC